MVHKLSANYIFPVTSRPVKNGIVVIDKNNTIIEIIEPAKNKEYANVEFYNGILVPGFVNTHCHLELSYLKHQISKHTKLTGFIEELQQNRAKYSDKEMREAAEKADFEMYNNGIVAVGDISNSDLTFRLKQKSRIYYHTFIELFSTRGEKPKEKFAEGENLYDKLIAVKLPASVVPHASYSLSRELFSLITNHAKENNTILSFHNQESEYENMLYKSRTGKLAEWIKKCGTDLSNIETSGKSALRSVLPKFPLENNLLLVHNTYTSESDIRFAMEQRNSIFWAFCPNANLYIENRLPGIPSFSEYSNRVTIGTDSLASNTKLSVLDELICISAHFPQISFNQLIEWATINGAKALNKEDKLGSIEQGKNPGINLVKNFDFQKMKLTGRSYIKRLI